MADALGLDTDIRQIALPRTGENFFATAESEKIVTIWSFQQRTRVRTLSTILDFGGDRLGLVSIHKPIVVSGSWRKGAAGYDGNTGGILWARRDLKKIQQVRDVSDNSLALIGIGVHGGAYHIVSAHTGEDWLKLQKVTEVYASAYEPSYLLVDSDNTIRLSFGFRSRFIWKRPLLSFAVLHAAFSPQHLAYSEANGSAYCVDFHGKELWKFQPEPGNHITRIACNSEGQQWLAISWNFRHGGPKRLLAINTDGNSGLLADIGNCLEAEFSAGGNCIITSAGEVISAQTGNSVWRFVGRE
jgi:hypothetical protein